MRFSRKGLATMATMATNRPLSFKTAHLLRADPKPNIAPIHEPHDVGGDLATRRHWRHGADNAVRTDARQDQTARDSTTSAIGRTAVPEPGPGADGQAWRGWYEERAAIREFDAGYPRPMAERLAFNETVDRWHRLFGARPDPARCAGCGELVSGREVLQLPGGARVHVDSEYVCLIEYGRRWRRSAIEALAALGLIPPEEWRP